MSVFVCQKTHFYAHILGTETRDDPPIEIEKK